MDEHEAIRLLQQGEIEGLEFLVRQYQLQATRAAYLILRDAPAAEDIVQSAFVRVYERIHQYDTTRPFAPWFFQIVINDSVKSIKRDRSKVSLDSELDPEGITMMDHLMDQKPGPETQIEGLDLRQKIWDALRQLSPEQRAVIVFRYYLDLSEKEIAGKMGSPKGTVKWRLHAARQRLRKLLQPTILD